jgi:hypothetical protein
MFTTSIDRSRTLVEVKLEGFMTVREVGQLRAQLATELDAQGIRPGAFVELIDVTEFYIQSQEVVAAFSSFTVDPRLVPQRLGFLSVSASNRMQARRTAACCPTRMFENRADALAWLAEPANKAVEAA